VLLLASNNGLKGRQEGGERKEGKTGGTRLRGESLVPSIINNRFLPSFGAGSPEYQYTMDNSSENPNGCYIAMPG
jgi:hypothetical protein